MFFLLLQLKLNIFSFTNLSVITLDLVVPFPVRDAHEIWEQCQSLTRQEVDIFIDHRIELLKYFARGRCDSFRYKSLSWLWR